MQTCMAVVPGPPLYGLKCSDLWPLTPLRKKRAFLSSCSSPPPPPWAPHYFHSLGFFLSSSLSLQSFVPLEAGAEHGFNTFTAEGTSTVFTFDLRHLQASLTICSIFAYQQWVRDEGLRADFFLFSVMQIYLKWNILTVMIFTSHYIQLYCHFQVYVQLKHGVHSTYW